MNDHPVRDVFADGFRARSETDATLCETVRPLYLFKVQQTPIVAVRCECPLTAGAVVCRETQAGRQWQCALGAAVQVAGQE